MNFDSLHAQYIERCEAALKDVITKYFTKDSTVSAAGEYALLNGGKRVRGVLVQAVCDMLGGAPQQASQLSAAIEMVHAFSLIHDDLPCMDDDDMRRGKPATHIAFGEATALLAGDLLLAEAFQVLAGAPLSPQQCCNAVAILAKATGASGMIYGQELDLKYETDTPSEDMLRLLHRKKTGALISASVQLGIIAAGKDISGEQAATAYAETIGLVFQIVDDILDVTADQALLGKPVGSDAQQGKTTFVTMFGLQKAQQEVQTLTANALKELQQSYGKKSDFLCQYATALAQRAY